MDVFRKFNRHTQFYVDSVDGIVKNFDHRFGDKGDKFKDNEELEQKLSSIAKRIVLSAQEFQCRGSTHSHYLKKTQWLPYKNEELEETKEWFAMLTSMDKRIAQLFFYMTPYEVQWEDFLAIIRYSEHHEGFGGVLLFCGPFERQCAYIRSINKALALPLLLGSSIVHSLRFYLACRKLSLIECKDLDVLGKDLGFLLQEYGVMFSLIFKEIMSIDLLNYRKLIKELKSSGNIQGCVYDNNVPSPAASLCSPIALRYSLANTIRGLALDVDFSTLKFMSPSILASTEQTVKALNSGGECFVFSSLSEFHIGVKVIIQLVHDGEISPEILNKNVMKVLMLKRKMHTMHV
ncbi:hypothetical protein [Candidatus Chlamydia sanziniae]|uniref:Uncharacterized protein n=1 Tax=Candidatus Chlamydia sanziniae TaxID=1806891 RepID=A0A1A9HW28_9CHLA|nr:hypothetical protein [Candidatus Chlamydia sanziniae]ANH79045.1 hypothetical protein Cs308_0875 [Candidatus Chlamydia sanziniae]